MLQLFFPPTRARLWWALGIAVVLPVLATPLIATEALREYPGMYYLLIVAAAAAIGRLLAGGVAVIVSALLFNYEFLGAEENSLLLNSTTVGVFVAFCLIAIALTHLVAAADASRGRAETTSKRLELVRRVSDALHASIDYEDTLRGVGRVLIPHVADWYAVYLLDERTGKISSPWVDHLNPERVALARALWAEVPSPTVEDPGGVGRVMRTRQAELAAEVTDEVIADALPPSRRDLVPLIRALKVRSMMTVPMVSGDRVVGAIQLVSAESRRRYTAEDLALGEEIAMRAAVALENAALYRQREHEVRALQQRLLPRTLPPVPGVEVAARYVAAEESMLVGGDFYDLFPIGDGSWKAVIGDVSGKGVDAAALMGFVRFTLRAVSRDDTRPSVALRTLNRALREEVGDDTTFCTAAVVRVDPHDRGARLTIAIAGHPPPYVIRSDGAMDAFAPTGTLLGFLDDVDLTDTIVDVRPGDSLVLLTDGVLECSREPEWGDEEVPKLLSLTAGMGPQTIVDLIDGSVGAVEDRRADDVALLVLHLPDRSGPTDRLGSSDGAARALVLDSERRVVDLNASAARDLGYGRDEIVGRSVDDVLLGQSVLSADGAGPPGGLAGAVVLRRRDGGPETYAATTSTVRTADRVLHLARLEPGRARVWR